MIFLVKILKFYHKIFFDVLFGGRQNFFDRFTAFLRKRKEKLKHKLFYFGPTGAVKWEPLWKEEFQIFSKVDFGRHSRKWATIGRNGNFHEKVFLKFHRQMRQLCSHELIRVQSKKNLVTCVEVLLHQCWDRQQTVSCLVKLANCSLHCILKLGGS